MHRRGVARAPMHALTPPTMRVTLNVCMGVPYADPQRRSIIRIRPALQYASYVFTLLDHIFDTPDLEVRFICFLSFGPSPGECMRECPNLNSKLFLYMR